MNVFSELKIVFKSVKGTAKVYKIQNEFYRRYKYKYLYNVNRYLGTFIYN